MIALGSGPPLIVVPGIQGRWEWMQPALEALAARCRVVSFTLAGDRTSGAPMDRRLGFDTYVAQMDRVFERAGLERAALCGVSYGGLVALHYAAVRPERVTALVLASAPAPGWRPARRIQRYARAPRLYAPLFLARAPFGLWPEIAAACPRWRDRLRFTARHLWRVATAPMSPGAMGRRAELLQQADVTGDCRLVSAPTLVVAGEPALDRVLPGSDPREYVRAIPGARAVTIPDTGHIGLVTRPDRFAAIVCDFVHGHSGHTGEPRSGTRGPA